MATKKTTDVSGFTLAAPAKAPAKKAGAKQAGETTTFRGKVALAGFADGSTTVKQAAKATEKVAQTLRAMSDAGAKLESPVGRNVAVVTTTDAKLAKKFGLVPVKAATAKKAAGAKPTAKKAVETKAQTSASTVEVAPATNVKA
jgi:hypothetical protein